MALQGESLTIDHGTPRQVTLAEIDGELEALVREAMGSESRRTFGRMLTLVVYSEVDEPLETAHALVGEIVVRASGRAILIHRVPHAHAGDLEAFISTHCLMRDEEQAERCAELVTLHTHAASVDQLRNAVLSLRLQDLPLVVWWRAPLNLQDPLFLSLSKVCDQMILDSARFNSPAAQLAQSVAWMRRQSDRVLFGDINWARLIPWRELIAQFFDTPEHLDYLDRLDEMDLTYSERDHANATQVMLIVAWLATLLKWQVVEGSWQQKGSDHQFKLLSQGREIRVEIKADPNAEAPAGWLTDVAMRATGEPPAEFQINWCGEDCVTTLVKIGDRVAERSSSLYVPGEVTLVCEEFDAARRDRVYAQALQVLEQLIQ
ncbi:MAG: glucose-6-phosphate dehydrogenase assembly protein OpcA [Anaerolineae bacterium]